MIKRNEPAPWIWMSILLVVVCLPRLTIDMYLPSLPAMADALHATDSQLQLTLTLYMVGYALSMLVCGPLADRYGRRPVLLGGTALFLAATVVCASAATAPVIIVARMFQALGGCSGTIVGRVMVRDKFDKATQAHLLSRLSMGMALSPLIAPIVGSVIEMALGWRWVFVALSVAAAASLTLVGALLPETKPRRIAADTEDGVMRIYRRLLHDAYFLRYSLAISFVYCTYFPFIAESSTLLQRSMHLPPIAYALVFAATVAGYVVGSSLFRHLSRGHATDTLITYAAGLNLAGTALLVTTTMYWPDTVLSIVFPMAVVMLSVGVAIPACQFAVLQPYAAVAGTASGLFFFIQMAITALCSFATGKLSNGTVGPMVIMTSIASIAFCFVWFVLRRPHQRAKELAVARE